ncbi:hypothetical protein [Streptomyces sp. NPDC040750]|uniref:hypothetical protein n=1 Tax=Streptomyces sp. NPDC040750 TaxID=3154491 RepID=UPI003400BB2F
MTDVAGPPRRRSDGFPDANRDSVESPSGHLSGETPRRALPPPDPCPAGRRTGRPACPRRIERGLATASHEKEAGGLLSGLLEEAPHFDHRLPEMFAGGQRKHLSLFRTGGLPNRGHRRSPPWSCCSPLSPPSPVRPDAPDGTITLCPVRGAPLGEFCLTGLRLAGAPFVIPVGRQGLAVVE